MKANSKNIWIAVIGIGAIPISSTKESYGKEINVAYNNYNLSIGINLCHTLYWI